MAVNEGAAGDARAAWMRTIGSGSRRVLAAVTQPVFGSWEWNSPPWLRWIGAQRRRAGGAMRARPRTTAAGVVLVGALLAGGYAGWLWWEVQPKPVLTTYTVA